MKAEVGLAVARGEHRHPDPGLENGAINLIKQFVPWPHALLVQERAQPLPPQVVIEESGHSSLCVRAPVVQEHITRCNHSLCQQLRSPLLAEKPALEQAHCQ